MRLLRILRLFKLLVFIVLLLIDEVFWEISFEIEIIF